MRPVRRLVLDVSHPIHTRESPRTFALAEGNARPGLSYSGWRLPVAFPNANVTMSRSLARNGATGEC
jgi:hypothetical protein